jgi:urate oxidase
MQQPASGASGASGQQPKFSSSFHLTQHNHGKAKVRVMKVRRQGSHHDVSEYTVDVTLFNTRGPGPDGYDKSFTEGDNTDLVATDTQKNTVYIIAKSCPCESPEQFGSALVEHFIETC